MAPDSPSPLKRWLTPPLALEHGATITLLVSFLLGAWLAGSWNVRTTIALVTALAAFEAQVPLARLLRNRREAAPKLLWLAIYGGLGAGGAIWLWQQADILGRIYTAVIAALALNLLWVVLRRQKSILNEVIVFLALTLALPFAFTATTGVIDQSLLGLWLLAALVLSSSVFTIRLRLEGERHMALATGYHLVALSCVFLLVRLNLLAAALAWTMLLPVGKLLVILIRMDDYRQMKLTHIGLWETALSVAFGLWVGLAA